MKIIIISAVALIIGLVLFAIWKKRHLTAKARQCAKEVQVFHNKLQELTAPTHFFTDEEVQQFKQEFAPLLKTVQKLYDSLFISNQFLNSLGLKDFIDERRLVNHLQYKNNQLFNSSKKQENDKR